MTIQQAILANPNATDAEILALVNAPVAKKIDLPTVRQLIAASGSLVSIEYGKASADEQVKYLCVMADKFLYLPFREDMVQLGGDHTQFLQLAGGLVQAGIITAETYAVVEALAFDVAEWTLSEVAWARHLMAVNARKQEVSVFFDAMNAAIDAVEVGGTLPTLAELRAI